MSSGAVATPRISFNRRIGAHDPGLRLYAILDAETCRRRQLDLLEVAGAWRSAGVQLLQYRDKLAEKEALIGTAQALRALFPPGEAFLILNDHPDLVAECGFDGAHVGQTDMTPEAARRHLGPDYILGVSTHSAGQALVAAHADADYLAIGPVFPTNTKTDADPVVGLCGVQAARAVTNTPLVAIGGIGLGDARAVEMAGADCVAVISALLPEEGLTAVTQRAQDFLERLK